MSQENDAQWFYAQNGQQFGPVTFLDLQQRVAAGQISGGDMIWRDGMAQWDLVSARGDLFAVPAAASLGYAAPAGYPNYPQPGMQYAGFWWRFLAAIIDGIITSIAGGIIGGALGAIIGLAMASSGNQQQIELVAGVAGQVVGLVLGWLYSALMESSAKQATLGKMACGIIVTDLNGGRISFGRATGRFFGKYVSVITLLIGYMMAGWTQ
ncbi:MAG TPA: RDD family protein, partial [Tepidisphaeraceae bacterium]